MVFYLYMNDQLNHKKIILTPAKRQVWVFELRTKEGKRETFNVHTYITHSMEKNNLKSVSEEPTLLE